MRINTPTLLRGVEYLEPTYKIPLIQATCPFFSHWPKD